MAIFKSSNPALKEKSFEGTILEGMSTGEAMTERYDEQIWCFDGAHVCKHTVCMVTIL